MEQTRPEDLKYSYCWFCVHYTALCPHCGGNACACGCTARGPEYEGLAHDEMPCILSKYWEAVEYAEEHGMCPKEPTAENIQERLDQWGDYLSNLSKEDKEKNKGFGLGHGLLDESEYWKIQDKAKNINFSIPTLEEFGERVGVEPTYDCKTGKDWISKTEIPIIHPSGWTSLESYNNERIPWAEYCRRRAKSDCDYRQWLNKLKGRKWITISDAKPGQHIRIVTGNYFNQKATIIENNNDSTLVRLDSNNEIVTAYAYNKAELID